MTGLVRACVAMALLGAAAVGQAQGIVLPASIAPATPAGAEEIRVRWWCGTCRPQHVYRAWRTEAGVGGQLITWQESLGPIPLDADRSQRRERRQILRIVKRNCRSVQLHDDGEISWCARDASDASGPARLLALAPALWQLPEESCVPPRHPNMVPLDGSGIVIELVHGDRRRTIRIENLDRVPEAPAVCWELDRELDPFEQPKARERRRPLPR